MCTVSFVNAGGKIIITSNRDEKISREAAIPPQAYMVNNRKVIFPRDPKAGGTWFAIKEDNTTAVLLNGAEESHTPTPPYSKSRGIILLDIIGSEKPIEYWNTIEFNNIEPFTIVLYSNERLYQLRWDSNNKSQKELDSSQNHIWASATLYSKEIQVKRKELFFDFLNTKILPVNDNILEFHQFTESEDIENGLVINRNGVLKTVSITQFVHHKNKVNLYYKDLMSGSEKTKTVVTI
ncbi:MAG: hypothetical protein BM557_00455 [Flavobacterium sp. MedPE-SWcel]|uniref:NRDE family protein n=1 Tax=uncultured Flavobacterium sp. TaxID=165435 RepID=UPI000923E4B2|nr:NRDE family protein [uncultured Flavobacterium sp.]OIQ22493.1 MAG: hypothetical protein BM557_00455 [Flavobacterium sp. MedPE-SWcel]